MKKSVGIGDSCEALDLRADDGEAAPERRAMQSGADVGRAHGGSQRADALGPPPLGSPGDALASNGVEEARSCPGTSRREVAHGEIARALTQELMHAAVAAYAAMPHEPGDCDYGRDEPRPGGTLFEGESDAYVEGLDADCDRSSVSTQTERGSTAATAAVLTKAAMAGGVAHSYGPGDEDTRRQCLLAHRQAQERALRSRYAREFGPLRRVVAAVGPTTTGSSAEAKGVSNDKLEEVATIDDGTDAPEPWQDESFPLHFENLAFQVGENAIRRVRDAICDSGASFNVVDENTARHNERRGDPEVTWWRYEKAKSLYAVSEAPVIVVGTCMMTILLKDELSRRWKKFNTHFFVIRFPQPRVILGVPFMRNHDGAELNGSSERVEFLGCRIGDGMVRPDDSKTRQIAETDFPQSLDDMKKFLGLAQWMVHESARARLCCAQKMGPLQERTHNSRAPTAEERACFEELKRILSDDAKSKNSLGDRIT
ncbi:hypothetical protein AB1Y20_013627 [Prymnesium parvum]|uniref:Uncharacterized protein n=1 Tax=Prymnesium parvum TaxID=97485 RepID=A0AB34IIC9_PRYPA